MRTSDGSSRSTTCIGSMKLLDLVLREVEAEAEYRRAPDSTPFRPAAGVTPQTMRFLPRRGLLVLGSMAPAAGNHVSRSQETARLPDSGIGPGPSAAASGLASFFDAGCLPGGSRMVVTGLVGDIECRRAEGCTSGN